MTDGQEYCREKAAVEGSNLYYASLYESDQNKQLIYPVFALHYELFDCLSASTDPGVIRLKLHWWQEELTRLFQNEARHPVSRALAPVIRENPYLIDYLQRHYLCMDSLLQTRSGHHYDEWKTHWFNTLGELWMSLEMLTGESENAPIINRNGGILFTLEILQNFYLLENTLPNFLPTDLLAKHQLGQDSLKQINNQANVSKLFGEILEDFLVELDAIYSEMRKSKIKPCRYHMIMNRLAYTLCKEIIYDGNQIMHHKVMITPLRKLLVSWRVKLFY